VEGRSTGSEHLPCSSHALTSAPLRMSKQQHAKCVWLPVVRLLKYDAGQARLHLHLTRSIVELRQREWRRRQRARQQTPTLAGCKSAQTMICSRPLQQLQRQQRQQQLRLLEQMQMQILQSRRAPSRWRRGGR
jgi:hypothetical protein